MYILCEYGRLHFFFERVFFLSSPSSSPSSSTFFLRQKSLPGIFFLSFNHRIGSDRLGEHCTYILGFWERGRGKGGGRRKKRKGKRKGRGEGGKERGREFFLLFCSKIPKAWSLSRGADERVLKMDVEGRVRGDLSSRRRTRNTKISKINIKIPFVPTCAVTLLSPSLSLPPHHPPSTPHPGWLARGCV